MTHLYVSFTFKISFDHDIFFGLAWWKDIFTSRDVTRGEYNVLSKIITRNVSQSEKDIIWSHIIKIIVHTKDKVSYLNLINNKTKSRSNTKNRMSVKILCSSFIVHIPNACQICLKIKKRSKLCKASTIRSNYDNAVFWGIIRNWINISPHANFLIIFFYDGFFLIF